MIPQLDWRQLFLNDSTELMDHKQTNVMVSTKNKTKSFPKNKFNLMGKTIPGVAMIQVSANAQ